MKNWVVAAAVGMVVFISRVPFLDAGYGWDTDAWGNMQSAQRLHETGEMTFARPPGYPVFVAVASLFWPSGPVGINAFTALCSAIAAAAFFLLMGRAGFDARRSALATLAMAAVPVVYNNSTVAMDYIWALAAILGAWCAAATGRPVWAGVLLGVATGCRITSAGMWIPIALFWRLQRRPGRGLLALTLSTAVVGAAAFAPVVLKNGFGYLILSIQPLSDFRPFILHSVSDNLWGLVGSAALVAALLSRAFSGPGDTTLSAPWRTASLTAVVLYVALFFGMPAESAYLIPIVPFVVLLLAGALRRRVFITFCVAMIASPFLLHFPRPPLEYMKERAKHSLQLAPRLAWRGPVAQFYRARRQQMEGIRVLAQTVARLGTHRTLVVCDAYYDYAAAMPEPRLRVVRSISAEETKSRLDDGEAVVFARGYNNKLLLIYEARLSPDGRLGILVHHLLSDRHGPVLRELSPSPPDRAMMATTVEAGSAMTYVESFLRQPGLVPTGHETGQALTILHDGEMYYAMFDDAERGDTFRAMNPGMTLREQSGGEMVLSASKGMGLVANPGFVTERYFPPHQVADLRAALGPEGVK